MKISIRLSFIGLLWPIMAACGGSSVDMNNPESISKAVIKIVETGGLFVVSVDLTLSESLAGSIKDLKYITYSWVNGNGESIRNGAVTARPVTDGLKDEAGGVITIHISGFASALEDMTGVKFVKSN